jgi:hypothetical protein
MDLFERKSRRLEEIQELAKENLELQRKLSRTFFFSSVFGGFGFFFALAGPSKTMTFPKLMIFCYGVNHVMKGFGLAGLILAVDD